MAILFIISPTISATKRFYESWQPFGFKLNTAARTRLNNIFRMYCHMFNPRREFEIFYSIVCFYTINVMDYFTSKKISSEMGLHHKPMFENGGASRFWPVSQIDISTSHPSTPFPIIVKRAKFIFHMLASFAALSHMFQLNTKVPSWL